MQYVDAHCHLDFPRFDGCLESELAAARAVGVSGFVVPGVRAKHWGRVQALATSPHKGIYYCLGIHPWYVGEHSGQDLDNLETLLSGHSELCVGVGECGLDRLRGDLAIQLPWFEAQVKIASRYGYPLVIHSVKTHDEVFSILRRLNWCRPALIHGFSGSYQQAKKLVDLGCYIGVGGVITHSHSRKTRDAVARLPLEALILETDAPDMAPEGVAAGRNAPSELIRIAEALAELRGMPEAALAPVLLENVQALYGRDFGKSDRR